MPNKRKQRIGNPRLRHASNLARASGNRTWQECEIAQVLENSGVTYTSQAPFLIRGQELILDFLLKSPRGIPVAVECSYTTKTPSVLRRKARNLDARFRFLKEDLCMGTIACLYLSSAPVLDHLIHELRKWMTYTDVIIRCPKEVIPAVITAGEKVFEALSSIIS